jgi:hypothetical protein
MAQRASFKPPNVVPSTSIPMESFTSNRHAFVSHVLEPRWQRPPETYKPSGQPLESLTTNRHDFQGLAGGVPASCKPKTNEVRRCQITSDCGCSRDGSLDGKGAEVYLVITMFAVVV